MHDFDINCEIKRRELLTRLVAAGLAMGMFSGCGGGAGSSSSGDGADSAPVIGPGNVSGRVDLSQIGGQGLQVLSAFQDPSSVTASGDFNTSAASSGAQLLFVMDSTSQIRALTVSLPTPEGALAPLVFSAETTALAWIMLTPGIVTTDPARAATTAATIRSLPDYQAVVDFLAARLPTRSLFELRSDPQFDALMSAVILDFASRAQLDVLASESISARGEQVLSKGGVKIQRGANNPGSPNTPFTLTNEAWRFVSVIRQEILPSGKEDVSILPVVPFLEQSVQVENNLLPGVNNLSIGNVALGQFNVPGSATDRVNLSDPILGSVVYWIHGPGAGFNRLFGTADALPPSIPESDFGNTAVGVSAFFYVLLPIVDFGTAGLGALSPAKLIENVLKVWENFAKNALNFSSLNTAFHNGDADGVKAAVFELCQALVTLGGAAVVAFFEGTAAATAALALGLLVTAVGLVFSAFNTLIAVRHWLELPITAKVEVPVLEPPGLFFLAQEDAIIHGVNDKGTVLYSTPGEGLVLKLFGATPIQLSPIPSVAAALNSLDDCVYRDAEQKKVIFRPGTGKGLITLLPPAEIGDPESFLPAFVNDLPVVVGTFQTTDGRIDAWANGKTNLVSAQTASSALNITAKLNPNLKSINLLGFNNQMVLIGSAGVTLSQKFKDGTFFIPGFFDPPVTTQELVRSEGLHFNFKIDLSGGQLEPGASVQILDIENPANTTPPPPQFLELNNQGHILVSVGAGARIEPVGPVAGAQTVAAFIDDDEVAGGDMNGLQELFSNGSAQPLAGIVQNFNLNSASGFVVPDGLVWQSRLMKGKFAIVRDSSGLYYLLARAS